MNTSTAKTAKPTERKPKAGTARSIPRNGPPGGDSDRNAETKSDAGPHRLWGGRFAGGPAPSLDELNRSLPVDRRLWREDIQASRAWAQALAGVGVLTPTEATEMDAGLVRVAERLAEGEAEDARDEDIHTLVERLLYEEVGDLAGKLHTGRSRNDQVATDTRLWALGAGTRLDRALRDLEAVLIERAEAGLDLLIPAYTHLRRAQVIRVGQWLLAHVWALERDRERLAGALERTATLPLGSGAVGGSGFPVDRTLLKEVLGFRGVSPNSLDAVGDRDWMVELVFAASLAGTHLSRLAEDLILYSSPEFGFLRLPEAYTTGSSLLPQKRNPDGLELARAKAARLSGNVTAALGLLKGLPTGYHKDLQEDKALLFDAFDTLITLLPATTGTVAGIEFNEAALTDAANDSDMLATDLADALVRRGVPFREAHTVVGGLVSRAERQGVGLDGLSDAERADAHPALATGPRPRLTPERSVEARGVYGGTSREAMVRQLEAARAAVGRGMFGLYFTPRSAPPTAP